MGLCNTKLQVSNVITNLDILESAKQTSDQIGALFAGIICAYYRASRAQPEPLNKEKFLEWLDCDYKAAIQNNALINKVTKLISKKVQCPNKEISDKLTDTKNAMFAMYQKAKAAIDYYNLDNV